MHRFNHPSSLTRLTANTDWRDPSNSQTLPNILMHQTDTVNCVASGREQHVTLDEVYKMSQEQNKEYRWKRAFQIPPVLHLLPDRATYMELSSEVQRKIHHWVQVDCDETADDLKLYAQDCIKALDPITMKPSVSRKRKSAVTNKNNALSDISNVLNEMQLPSKTQKSRRKKTIPEVFGILVPDNTEEASPGTSRQNYCNNQSTFLPSTSSCGFNFKSVSDSKLR